MTTLRFTGVGTSGYRITMLRYATTCYNIHSSDITLIYSTWHSTLPAYTSTLYVNLCQKKVAMLPYPLYLSDLTLYNHFLLRKLKIPITHWQRKYCNRRNSYTRSQQ